MFQEKGQEELKHLHEELKMGKYKSLPVRRVYTLKRGKPQEKRPLGIPAIRDRVCQQALNNKLEPMYEPTFNDCSYGYRLGRLPHDALRKIWKELVQGFSWIVDADLKDYISSIPHEKLIELVAEKVSYGRVLKLIRRMLEAGYVESGKHLPTP